MSRFSSLSRNAIEYLKLRHETLKLSGSDMPSTLLDLESQVDIGLLADLQKLTSSQVAEIVSVSSSDIVNSSDIVASDIVASDPVASDPVASDPVASDPVASDPVVEELSLLDSIKKNAEDTLASLVDGLETAAINVIS